MSTPIRRAVVTGVSRGLGLAIAARFLDDGYAVVGISRGASPLAGRDGFSALRADLSDHDVCATVIDSVRSDHGPIDVLVNNAATMVYTSVADITADQLQTIVDLNLTTPFILSRDVVRNWLAEGATGNIVNISSVESDVAWPNPLQAAYATTKGGLVGLTRAMALELAGSGIRVNAVAPGALATEMSSPDPNVLDLIPQGRLGTPEEIAASVAHVAGPDASYMTGEVLYIDGGYRLQ
ncbi:SDR family oxidoreductase [Nocardioides cavernae]|uniref:SDR family oxidoreductase n=1 Tax=Nocardioides cavernae TaxID=1921566 RepID=A0ABR8N9J5_9ACTN|nr:SDR family oxidoreductase [Nocardioides cavernae]MBD3924271.1 SDR family oxidoreductase [Nocardioides cavernae]MBM7510790.1 NAD(P)-dependent dehydrogenase (short-subunit alcohol dehydrogenase family) [Nocardioides cavernae]